MTQALIKQKLVQKMIFTLFLQGLFLCHSTLIVIMYNHTGPESNQSFIKLLGLLL